MMTDVDTYRAAQNNNNLTAGNGSDDGPLEKDFSSNGKSRAASEDIMYQMN